MCEFFHVPNWQEHQHYKNRTPPWIKLHRSILHDYGFSCLQDASKAHLLLIWILASQTDNTIPLDAKFLKKNLGLDKEPDLQLFEDKGFIVRCKHSASALCEGMLAKCPPSRDRGEAETEERREETALSGKPDAGGNGSVLCEEVFDHWKLVMDHPRAILDPKRKALIKSALGLGYPVQALKDAITGCSYTPHNIGINDRGTRYDGLHIIFKDGGKIDSFIGNFNNPPRMLNHGGNQGGRQSAAESIRNHPDNPRNKRSEAPGPVIEGDFST